MGHDWIFDVLADLRAYALKNGLPGLAAQVEVTLRVARDEVAAQGATEDEDGSQGGPPPTGRAH